MKLATTHIRPVLGLSFAALLSAQAHAGLTEDIENALRLDGGGQGRVTVDARYRYEYVDQEQSPAGTGPDRVAHASTVRTRIGYLTPTFRDLSGFAEYEGTQDIGANDYDSTRNEKRAYPVVADPQHNEINQLWVNYAGLPDSALKLGRQRIVFDNHRFVGNVIWRQMEQTYDAVTFTNTSLPATTLTLGYLWKVQDVTSRSAGMNSPIFNLAYTGLPFGKLVLHGEWLDWDNVVEYPPTANQLANSLQTVGARFDGATPVADGIRWLYTAEYAWQEDYAQNPKDFKVDYWLAETGVDVRGVVLKAAYEELGADNGQGFRTPLATLHAFQGWADKFLLTPRDGIRDLYGTARTRLGDVDWTIQYHEYSAANGGADYGHELDFMAEKKFARHYSVLLKYADYAADGYATDTRKFWIQTAVSF